MTAIFPSLLGIGIGVKRTPVWSTLIQTSISGKETRASFQAYPRYRYQIPLNFARVTGFSAQTPSNEMATIQAFFMAAVGELNYFDYTDPYSNTATLTPFGTGNGSTTTFQLLDIEGFPIYDLNGAASVYVNGGLTTPASIVNGLVTFSSAPGNTYPLTWSGGYYRRCRFDMDEFEMEQIVNLCWGKGTIKLISVK